MVPVYSCFADSFEDETPLHYVSLKKAVEMCSRSFDEDGNKIQSVAVVAKQEPFRIQLRAPETQPHNSPSAISHSQILTIAGVPRAGEGNTVSRSHQELLHAHLELWNPRNSWQDRVVTA
jgi:hypothetical protein